MLLVLYFFVVIALPLALGSYVVYNGLPRSRACLACGDETLRLQSVRHRIGSLLMRRELHSRWCMSCGWRGTALVHSSVTQDPGAIPAMGPDRTRTADRVDLRTLDVDGRPWRVMLECWAEGGRWLARLVFIAPGGQVCADQRSLEGGSVLEVISQAFRLPEQTLAGRLRSIR